MTDREKLVAEFEKLNGPENPHGYCADAWNDMLRGWLQAHEASEMAKDAARLLKALKHQRTALALLRDRQTHDGVCRVSLADLEQGIRQIDAAIRGNDA
jgi:hypothetical protein